MLLCEKFQARFGGSGAAPAPALILLNEAALELAVPRRRLYDIINVLEAVEVRARAHARCSPFPADRLSVRPTACSMMPLLVVCTNVARQAEPVWLRGKDEACAQVVVRHEHNQAGAGLLL